MRPIWMTQKAVVWKFGDRQTNSEWVRERERENSACLLYICWAKSIGTLLVCIHDAYSLNIIVILVLSCQSTHIQTHCKRQLYTQYTHTHTHRLDILTWWLNLMKCCQKERFLSLRAHISLFLLIHVHRNQYSFF